MRVHIEQLLALRHPSSPFDRLRMKGDNQYDSPSTPFDTLRQAQGDW